MTKKFWLPVTLEDEKSCVGCHSLDNVSGQCLETGEDLVQNYIIDTNDKAQVIRPESCPLRTGTLVPDEIKETRCHRDN